MTDFVSYATKLSEAFATRALEIFYASAVTDDITNNDYEGEIKDKASVLNILTFQAITAQTYTGSNLTVNDINESNAQLKTDQQKAFYFRIKSLAKFQSYIKNPDGTILDQTGRELKKVIDQFVLGKYTSTAAGNRIGTNATAGTVAVDSAGNVTGTSTSFTSAMIGRGFQANGQTSWYRVATVTNSTTMTIVDDVDDSGAGTYTGGTVAGGTSYTVEAVTPLQLTKATVYDYFNQLSTKLDNLEIPEDQRWAAIPPDIALLVREAPEYIPSGSETALEEVVKRGKIGQFAGFTIYKTKRVSGDNVNGYHVMAGHKSAITFAMGFIENGIEDLIGNFGKAYKSLNVYGAKVADERRKALTELFCYK